MRLPFFMQKIKKGERKVLNYAIRHSTMYLGGKGMKIKIKAPKSFKFSIKLNLVVLQIEIAFEY
ncbi:hypothetical protein CD113_10345 [Staphylococcus simiae]|uniref:Uncharacterized protein n=1 Tax=Staphylococcus simiae CCM 7213 = CCUG 51256 TaxID=911238 RepID=G5JIQ0_9STAP|nr:hypothetical protein SS7213T_06691 [Staphylococcus simiae CCM 7213 = CCUG 51256]PNZ10420.1 hypothetical protein CD113_10345 [Staphylococcus simiae]